MCFNVHQMYVLYLLYVAIYGYSEAKLIYFIFLSSVASMARLRVIVTMALIVLRGPDFQSVSIHSRPSGRLKR